MKTPHTQSSRAAPGERATRRFRQVDALFEAVLDLPTEEHDAFLEQACEGDPDLRESVQRLLLAHRRSVGFLESPALELAAPLLQDADDLAPNAVLPVRIGSFRVVQEIGHGGMGTVYLGERDDGHFTQRVALKLIRSAGDEHDLVRRFLEERRILALLDHPRIARLIDGGFTTDGRPYFAMEFVDGQAIDDYCDTHELSIDQRLELFAAVCEAAQYAHQQLVVHRDLKPSNILVTADGQLKLLDFGIAKLVDPLASVEDPTFTRSRLHPMTPEYAAPEQVRGDPVSTATDIYALGVLLYVLLTGRRPYEVRGHSPGEIERLICEVEPPRPSSRFGTDAEKQHDPATRARARGATPARLRRLLRGDLDLIIKKALHKEAGRRYTSAAALQEDLDRFRQGRPVVARPDSPVYQMRKFVSRHRGGVAVAAVVVLALAAGAIRERALRARAEGEADKARAVQEYIVSVFDVADPFAFGTPPGADVTARELLERGAERVDSALATQPHAQAELRGVFGRVYANLGLLEEAIPHLEQSLEQRRSLYGSRNARVAEAMDRLGEALLSVGRLDEAEGLLRDALSLRREILGDRDPATAESLDHLATLFQERNRYDDAEPLFREALEIRRALLGDDDPAVAGSLTNLGLLVWLKGAYDAAEPLQREALAIQERRLGENHPLTAQTLNNLAQVQQFRGQIDEAEALFRRALAAKRAILGDPHPSVTVALNNLAWLLYQEQNKLDEAEALSHEALVLDRQIFGEHHAYVASSLSIRASILAGRGELREAERLHREVLEMRRSLYSDPHLTIARSLGNLADVRYVQGDLAGAETLFRQSADQTRHFVGESHPRYLAASVNLARILSERGDLDDAERLLRAAMNGLDPLQRQQLLDFVSAQVGLGQILTASGRAGEAVPLLERALEMILDRSGEESWRTAETRLALGEALALTGRIDRAERLLLAAHTALQKQRQAQPRRAMQARSALAKLYESSGRPGAARQYALPNL